MIKPLCQGFLFPLVIKNISPFFCNNGLIYASNKAVNAKEIQVPVY